MSASCGALWSCFKRLELLAVLLFSAALQAQPPVCTITATLAAPGDNQVYDNRPTACGTWQLTFTATGYSAVTLALETAADSGGAPSTWTTQLVITGATTQTGAWSGSGQWVRIRVTAITGYGSIAATASGWTGGSGGGGGGGGLPAGGVIYNQGSPGAVNRSVASKLQETASVKDFGAMGNTRWNLVGNDASISAGSSTLTSPNLHFTQADVGALIKVIGAGATNKKLATVNYVSGGTVTGTGAASFAGNTCLVNSGFNNGLTGATFILYLTSNNTLVGAGIRLTITGTGATAPPTQATLTNGTAQCSGTITITSTLGASNLIAKVTSVNGNAVAISSPAVTAVTNARAYVGNDDTSAIQAAINAGLGTLYLPTGIYMHTGLKFGSSSSSVYSMHFFGDGGWDNSGHGSSLMYAGVDDGPAIQVWSAQHCTFDHLTLDGGGNAGYTLVIAGNNGTVAGFTPGGGSNHRNNYHDLTISGAGGWPGVQLYNGGNYFAISQGQTCPGGSLCNQDVSTSKFDHITILQGYAGYYPLYRIGVLQDGNQSLVNEFNDVTVGQFGYRAMDFEQGDVRLFHSQFADGYGSYDDVYVSDLADWVSVFTSYHEIHFFEVGALRHAYNFPTGSRYFPTILDGVRVLWNLNTLTNGPTVPGITALFFGSVGPLSIHSTSWDSMIGAGQVWQINNTKSATMFGNLVGGTTSTINVTGPCVTDIPNAGCSALGLQGGVVKPLYSAAVTSDLVCSYAGDTSVAWGTGVSCNNTTTDASGAVTPFASAYTIPAGQINYAGAHVRFVYGFRLWSPSGTVPASTMRWYLGTGVATPVLTSAMATAASLTGVGFGVQLDLTDVSLTTAMVSPTILNFPGGTNITAANALTQPSNLPVALTAAMAVAPQINFSTGGVSTHTGTYTYASGLSGCTDGTQLATATNGGGAGATANIVSSGGVPSGVLTTVTTGKGYTSQPTTWTVATCTGTGTFTTTGVLGGVQGLAVQITSISVEQTF